MRWHLTDNAWLAETPACEGKAPAKCLGWTGTWERGGRQRGKQRAGVKGSTKHRLPHIIPERGGLAAPVKKLRSCCDSPLERRVPLRQVGNVLH